MNSMNMTNQRHFLRIVLIQFEEYASFLDEYASNVDEETLIALKEFVLWLPFLSKF